MTSPLDGQSFDDSTSYSPIDINATASEDSGTISKVDFFVNNTKVGTSTAEPYSFSWTPSGYATNSDGIDNFALTVKATDTSSLVGTSTTVNIKVKLPIKPVPIGSLQVSAYEGIASSSVNYINPKIKITNTGANDINLSDVTLRYYYTTDGEGDQSFWCDWATACSSSVTGKFVKLSPAAVNADYYLEIGFTTAAGTLAADASFELASRFAKNDWSNFNQGNDYSFDSTSSSYSATNKITAYIGEKLVSGIEP
ncbi:MAG: cellulose binding domain-containing protein [Clostridium sp.]|nr:cellulose binding domain-containing protein [Clostridium sp.]